MVRCVSFCVLMVVFLHVSLHTEVLELKFPMRFLWKFDILVTYMHLEYGRGQGPRTPMRFAYNGGDLLTHWGRNKMAAIFQTTYSNGFSWWISINMSLEFVPRGPINNIPTLVQVMAWRRPGDYLNQWWFGLNELKKKISRFARLFHAPTRTTSSGCLVLHSEAIRDVKQTTLRELTAFRINE